MENKEITDYFRWNIFESLSAYNAWKMLAYSKSKVVVSDEMATRYIGIQNYHLNFFVSAERAFLVDFVIMSLHSFDKRDDSFSLYKVNQKETEKFVEDNADVIDKLKKVRCKLFAHRDNSASVNLYEIPPIIDLDCFFKNLIKFYNLLTVTVDNSSTVFTDAEAIKRDVELLFMNLYRGENARKMAIDIQWTWEKDDKKISDVI